MDQWIERPRGWLCAGLALRSHGHEIQKFLVLSAGDLGEAGIHGGWVRNAAVDRCFIIPVQFEPSKVGQDFATIHSTECFYSLSTLAWTLKIYPPWITMLRIIAVGETVVVEVSSLFWDRPGTSCVACTNHDTINEFHTNWLPPFHFHWNQLIN